MPEVKLVQRVLSLSLSQEGTVLPQGEKERGPWERVWGVFWQGLLCCILGTRPFSHEYFSPPSSEDGYRQTVKKT